MAGKILCSVVDPSTGEQCDRWFVPGSGGARGKCWMHLQREYRNSKRANLIDSLKGKGRTEKWTLRMADNLRDAIAVMSDLDGGKTPSEWMSDIVTQAVELREKRKTPFRVAELEDFDTKSVLYLSPATLRAVRRWVKTDGGSPSEWMLHAIAVEVARRQKTKKRPPKAA